MPVIFKLPTANQLVDRQFFQVPVADGLLQGYQFDAQTNTLYAKESQIVIPSMHGITHINEDPIPTATCDSQGLMSADDKCKLDALLQMRLGILGFQGSGFPDDGGFLVGDIILAAGSEFISIERIGNTVRFTVDSPIPLNCGCETCTQIFWVQDESAVRAIRPPSCNGVMPDVNGYGQFTIVTLPESTIVDPKDPLDVLSEKGKYPTFAFRRYLNGLTPIENELEVILKRNANLTTNVGWAMTPGPLGVAETVWFVGTAKNNKQMTFSLLPESEPGLLGSLLFNGHLITKQVAVVVDYTAGILADNKYVLRKWDVQNNQAKGSKFTAQNVWRYSNPENSPVALSNPQKLTLDATVGLLPIGTLVDIYEFEISKTANQRITRAFFSKEPSTNPDNLWNFSGGVRFGDLFTAREEINNPVAGTAVTASEIDVSDSRLFERTIWGLNGFEDRLLLSDDGEEIIISTPFFEPSGQPINNDIVADIDPTIPGLLVTKQIRDNKGDINGDGIVDEEDLRRFACAYGTVVGDPRYNADADFNGDGKIDIRDLALIGQYFDLGIDKVSDRPIFLWHRQNHKNALIKAKIGMPSSSGALFPPYDFLLQAPVDSFDDVYMKVIRRGIITTGVFAGNQYVVVKGIHWKDIPQQGVIRVLTGAFRNAVWRYYFRTAFSSFDDDAVMLIGRDEQFPYDTDFPIQQFGTECTIGLSEITTLPTGGPEDAPSTTTVVELLRQDFTAPIVRFQFDVNETSGSEAVQLQVFVGMLDMGVQYERNVSTDPRDDLVRGFAPGVTASKILIQDGIIEDGVGTDISSNPEGFRVYVGGELEVPVDGETEKWNEVEIMLRNNQVWIWFNGLLVSPDPTISAALGTPVSSPYFPINPQVDMGKIGLRMFPSAVVRSFEIRDQLLGFNEYSKGQLELVN